MVILRSIWGIVFMMAFMASVMEYFFETPVYPGMNLWMVLFAINLLGILIAVPNSFYNKETFKAALQVPKAIGLMFMTLFKLKGANKKFIHTPHSSKINPPTSL